jgi:hypothetical protein
MDVLTEQETTALNGSSKCKKILLRNCAMLHDRYDRSLYILEGRKPFIEQLQHDLLMRSDPLEVGNQSRECADGRQQPHRHIF